MIAHLPDGLEVAYDDVGRGTPVLFIHGWPHNRSLWAGQVSGLSTLARCIAPDLRGFGGTSVREPYSIDRYADDLVALLDARAVDRAVVCGLSMGGYVALAMLRRHRVRVRALILTSTRATADTPEAREKRMRLVDFVRSHGMEALAARQLKAMVGHTTLDRRPEVRESLRRMMAAAPSEGVIGALHAMAERADSSAVLPTIDVPTLVVGGAEDGFTPPSELRTMAADIPDSRCELLEASGHACAYERPGAFNHVVSEFLGRLRSD
ncbi:MAG TPA: alpha/beta fold hydrolase [Gemmatimonadaceae bacterium]|nr:alpha/beta fold hydrolase [Gemmatimonadaceae bacterium]